MTGKPDSKGLFFATASILGRSYVLTDKEETIVSVLVGREAPDFTAPAVLGNGEIVDEFNFKEVTKGKYAVLFFYPLDFTFVCPSELIAFDHRLAEFTKRGVEVIGVSIDSHYTHNAWRKYAHQGRWYWCSGLSISCRSYTFHL